MSGFTASYGGEPVEISAGEWCADGHELVRRFPRRFRRADQAPAPPARARDYLVSPANTTPPGALPIPRWAIPIPSGPLLPPGPQIVRAAAGGSAASTVRVTPYAREDICEVVEHTPEGFETGGLLLGFHRAGRFRILEAEGPGANAIRQRDRLVLDIGAKLDRALAVARDPAVNFTLSPLGTWHMHPTAALEPSDADLRLFAGISAQLGGRRCAHLIVSPGGAMTAWVVRHDDRPLERRLVCERAEIDS